MPSTALLIDGPQAPAAGAAGATHVSLGQLEHRILDAACELVARWGVAKTSLADVAKAAGCARATVYRAFPGGKSQLFTALGARELATYLAAIVHAIDESHDLTEAVTAALVEAARRLRDHQAAQAILQHEPGLVLPLLGFHQVDRVYRATATMVGPHLERHLPAELGPGERGERAAWAAEWAARLLISYVFNPTESLTLTNAASTRRLVDRFITPAFTSPFPHPAVRGQRSNP